MNVWLRRPTGVGLAILVLGALLLTLVTDAQETSAPALPKIPVKDFSGQSAYEVVKVFSGSVLVVRRDGADTTLRLIGLHVPEEGASVDEARAGLTRLLAGESVYLESEPDWPAQDSDERTWAYVYRAPDGLFVNLELVRQGYARVASAQPFGQEELLRAYERHARTNRKGLWGPSASARTASQPASKPAARKNPDPTGGRAKTDADDPVYVTPHGKKYHRKSCQYVKDGGTALTLKEARQKGYTPCSRCKPPE